MRIFITSSRLHHAHWDCDVESQYEAASGVGGVRHSVANPIGGDRMRQDCGSGASRLVPATVLVNAASGGRRARRSCTNMDYEEIFEARLAAVKSEGRYRTFANLSRHAGSFPYADCLDENTGSK